MVCISDFDARQACVPHPMIPSPMLVEVENVNTETVTINQVPKKITLTYSYGSAYKLIAIFDLVSPKETRLNVT